MIDVYIWIAVWVLILIMFIIELGKVESRAEDRINKMFAYLDKRKKERLAMPRYIDAEKIEYDKHKKIGLGIDYGLNESDTYYTTTKEKIDAITTADVVEVVRCKDCKYYNHQHHYCEGIGNWFGFEGEWSDNGFCYKGERKCNED